MARPEPMYEIALVGCGRVAEKHIKAMRQLHRKVATILLVDPVAAARTRILDLMTNQQRKLAKGYDSLEDLFKERKPDIVSITTPSNSHYPLARLALENRCHLFIEKPMTLNLDEARDLIQLAKVEERQIAVGHIYRFFPLVDLIQHEIALDKHGKVLHGTVQVQWGHEQRYYDLAAWRGKWLSDGGVLMNQSVHAVDLMQWLVGAKSIAAQGSIHQQVHRMEAEDYGVGLLHFDNGAVINIEGTTNTPSKRKRAAFSIVCEDLWFQASLEGKKISFSVYDGEGNSLKWHYLKEVISDMFSRGFIKSLRSFLNPHTGIYDDLFKSIEYRRTPRASAQDGFDAVAAVLGIYQSATKDGLKVKIPAEGFSLEDMAGFFSAYGKKNEPDLPTPAQPSKKKVNKKTPLAPASFQNPANYKHPGVNNEF